jgi:ABC-type multidrug transport system ATPase subunit
MITVEGVSKAYGTRTVLADLSFEARPGEVTLLVGANGSGKSTTNRILAGLIAADAGRFTIDGHVADPTRPQARRGLSFLPQSPRFHPSLTVTQILDFYAQLRGADAAAVARVTKQWALTDYLAAPTGVLSGGLRQRLALAVFSLPDAPVLALDEPGLSLDPDWRRFLQDELRSAAGAGRTVLVATHLLGEWEGRADRCLVLEHGRILRELAPDRLRQAFPFAVTHPQQAVAR